MAFSPLGLTVNGIPQLQHAFKQIPKRVDGIVLTQALNAAGGVFKRAIAASAATDVGTITGLLKRPSNIVVKAVSKKAMRKKNMRSYTVGPRHKTFLVRKKKNGKPGVVRSGPLGGAADMKVRRMRAAGVKLTKVNPGKYAHLVEFGHKAPTVGSRYSRTIGRRSSTGSTGKPTRPHPFMRPAFNAKSSASKRAFTKQFNIALSKQIQRLKKKTK